MKKILAFLLILIFQSLITHGQVFQRIKDRLKQKAEQKAMEKIDRGIDNIMDSTTGKIGRGKKKNVQVPEGSSSSTEKAEGQAKDVGIEKEGGETKEGEGFLELKVSNPRMFVGGFVLISGKSIRYNEFKTVEVTITGKGYAEKKLVQLGTDGSYGLRWNVPEKEGDYQVRVIGSDHKMTRESRITVYRIAELEKMADENIEQTNIAYKNLEEKVSIVRPMLGAEQAKELDKKLEEVKERKNLAIKLFGSINDANKKVADKAKKGAVLPRVLSENLSEMDSHLKKQSDEMKQVREFTNHTPADNSICEYLVMINEACAAFSTFSAFWEKSLEAVLKNIVLDKLPPLVVGGINEQAGKPVPEPLDFVPKEAGKLYTTSLFDMESLKSKKGKAGIAGDLIGFVADVLMKIFCGVYKGEVTHSYSMNYKNTGGESFWKYSVEMKAILNLRYPKDKNTGSIIKMKGSIEGNATKFTFWANPKEAVAEELRANGRYNMVETMTLYNSTPLAVNFSSAQKDNLGFGAIARGLVTPASFYIPIDAEYDQNTHKIKLFINGAILDFTPMVTNQQFYVVLAVLPLFRVMNYPIEKAEKTIRGSLKEKNYFMMKGEAQGKPQFEGTITREIRDPEFSIDLKIQVKAAKD